MAIFSKSKSKKNVLLAAYFLKIQKRKRSPFSRIFFLKRFPYRLLQALRYKNSFRRSLRSRGSRLIPGFPLRSGIEKDWSSFPPATQKN